MKLRVKMYSKGQSSNAQYGGEGQLSDSEEEMTFVRKARTEETSQGNILKALIQTDTNEFYYCNNKLRFMLLLS